MNSLIQRVIISSGMMHAVVLTGCLNLGLFAQQSCAATLQKDGAIVLSFDGLKSKKIVGLLPGQFIVVKSDVNLSQTAADRPEVVTCEVLSENSCAISAKGAGEAVVSITDVAGKSFAFDVFVGTNPNVSGPPVVDLDLNNAALSNDSLRVRAGNQICIETPDRDAHTKVLPSVAILTPQQNSKLSNENDRLTKNVYWNIWAIRPGDIDLGVVSGVARVIRVEAASLDYKPKIVKVSLKEEAAVYSKLGNYWRDVYLKWSKDDKLSKNEQMVAMLKTQALEAFDRALSFDSKSSALEARRRFLSETATK